MTMTRGFVDRGICILAGVALLLVVMSSPTWLSRASHTAPPPLYLPLNFALLEIWHSGLLAISARPSLRVTDSLQSDIEEELDADIEDELTVTSPPASVSFDALPSPCPKPYSELVSFAVPLAARPLRC
jgi:hypothetical protein